MTAKCEKCRAEYIVSVLGDYTGGYICPICSGERQYKTIDHLSKETRETRQKWRERHEAHDKCRAAYTGQETLEHQHTSFR